MDITLLILLVFVAAAMAIVFCKGGWQLIGKGFRQSGRIFRPMWFHILLGITIGGLFQVLIPNELIAEWLGPTSGLKGILIGSYVGIFSVGGPHIRLPILAAIYAAGAGVGPIIALLTAMNVISLQMLIAWQIPFFGVKIPLARYIACLAMPPFAGIAGEALYRVFDLA